MVTGIVTASHEHGRKDDETDDHEQEQWCQDCDESLVEIHLPEGTDGSAAAGRSGRVGNAVR